MKPPKREITYEKITTDDFVIGHIEDVLYEKDRTFRFNGEEKKSDACRLKFVIDGYKYPHSTPWMKFSYGEKTNLYKKYISSLVAEAKPDMEFDLDQLKGMKVKMLWKNDGDYQHIETIRPVEGKIIPVQDPTPQEKNDDEVPF